MTSRSQAARSRERHESGNAGVVYSGTRTLRLEPGLVRAVSRLPGRPYAPVPPPQLPRHRLHRTEPLARAEQAFLALESGAGVMKVLIDCQAEQGAGVAH